MAQALIVLERHKVFHRDIKPSNIFICADGSFKLGWRCFFLFRMYMCVYFSFTGDYGIARISGVTAMTAGGGTEFGVVLLFIHFYL
jgi:serine/threonine protein kinase